MSQNELTHFSKTQKYSSKLQICLNFLVEELAPPDAVLLFEHDHRGQICSTSHGEPAVNRQPGYRRGTREAVRVLQEKVKCKKQLILMRNICLSFRVCLLFLSHLDVHCSVMNVLVTKKRDCIIKMIIDLKKNKKT